MRLASTVYSKISGGHLHFFRSDVCLEVINLTAVEKKKLHFRNISYYHIRGAGPLYYIYQGFLSQRFKCHMQVKYKYISASSEQPSSNLFGFIERGMELHVDIGNDSSHSIFESEWMDISFTLGQH